MNVTKYVCPFESRKHSEVQLHHKKFVMIKRIVRYKD